MGSRDSLDIHVSVRLCAVCPSPHRGETQSYLIIRTEIPFLLIARPQYTTTFNRVDLENELRSVFLASSGLCLYYFKAETPGLGLKAGLV